MPPVALELDRFASATGRSAATSQVTNPQVVLGEYRGVRILAVEGRQQIDFAAEASDNDATTVANWVLGEVERFRPSGIGFNAILRIENDAGDPDPAGQLIRRDLAAERLETEALRYGIKLLYLDESARITLSVDPDGDDDMAWVASVNRHYASSPEGEERTTALEWFAATSHAFERSIRELVATPDHEQHAA